MKACLWIAVIVVAVLVATSVGQRRYHVRPRFDDFPAGLQYISGRYYGIPSSSNASGYLLSPNILYGVPIQIHHPQRFDQIATRVVTGAAGNAVVGIYHEAPSGKPGALLVQGDDVLDLTTSSTDITSTLSQVLSPGFYYLAFNGDASATIAGRLTDAWQGQFGRTTISGDEFTYVLSVHTYTGTLPDPFSETAFSYVGIVDSSGTGDGLPDLSIRAE